MTFIFNNITYSKIHPLFGHPFIKDIIPYNTKTLFPTGGLKPSWNSSKFNLTLLSRNEHLNAHIRLYQLEKFWEIYHSPITTGLNLENSILNQC